MKSHKRQRVALRKMSLCATIQLRRGVVPNVCIVSTKEFPSGASSGGRCHICLTEQDLRFTLWLQVRWIEGVDFFLHHLFRVAAADLQFQ